MRRTILVLSTSMLLMATPAAAQVALHGLNGDMTSSDVDPDTTASSITTPQSFMLAGGNFCATSDWLETTPQGPFNGSINRRDAERRQAALLRRLTTDTQGAWLDAGLCKGQGTGRLGLE